MAGEIVQTYREKNPDLNSIAPHVQTDAEKLLEDYKKKVAMGTKLYENSVIALLSYCHMRPIGSNE